MRTISFFSRAGSRRLLARKKEERRRRNKIKEGRNRTVYNTKTRPSRADGCLLLRCATQHLHFPVLCKTRVCSGRKYRGVVAYVGMRFLKLEVQQGWTRSSVAGLYRVMREPPTRASLLEKRARHCAPHFRVASLTLFKICALIHVSYASPGGKIIKNVSARPEILSEIFQTLAVSPRAREILTL